jgi:hypothetical protein
MEEKTSLLLFVRSFVLRWKDVDSCNLQPQLIYDVLLVNNFASSHLVGGRGVLVKTGAFLWFPVETNFFSAWKGNLAFRGRSGTQKLKISIMYCLTRATTIETEVWVLSEFRSHHFHYISL